jgi:hypothetical protein
MHGPHQTHRYVRCQGNTDSYTSQTHVLPSANQINIKKQEHGFSTHSDVARIDTLPPHYALTSCTSCNKGVLKCSALTAHSKQTAAAVTAGSWWHCEDVKWIKLAQDSDWWQDLVVTMMNLWVLEKDGNFWSVEQWWHQCRILIRESGLAEVIEYPPARPDFRIRITHWSKQNIL